MRLLAVLLGFAAAVWGQEGRGILAGTASDPGKGMIGRERLAALPQTTRREILLRS